MSLYHEARILVILLAMPKYIRQTSTNATPAAAKPTSHRTAPPEADAEGPNLSPGVEPRTHTGDSFKIYLCEVGKVKLLTPEEEIKLAARIQAGDASAREHMIKANLRLVVKIARDYEGLGLPLLDLISEGNIGLMKAVERFDPTKGAKFSTYSSFWIKQAIRSGLSNQSKTIRLPIHVVEKLTNLRRAEARLYDEFGREPTAEELAADLGMEPRRVDQYRNASLAPTSLDAPIGDEDSNRIAA